MNLKSAIISKYLVEILQRNPARCTRTRCEAEFRSEVLSYRKIIGYAYAGSYSPRKAYDWTVTTSIYVDKEYRRQGIGSLLYDSLEEELKKRGIVNLLAGVAFCENEDEYLVNDSKNFHLSKGYSQVAHMEAVGKKFDRWYDLLWFQKKL